MSSAVSDHFLYRLKAATRDLVKLVGGVVRAGEITSHSKTTVSRWQSVTDPDVIDLCAAIALEVECGVPLITTVMAEAGGRRLSAQTEASTAASVLVRHAELMRAGADIASHLAAAMADNTITPAEAEAVDRSLAAQEAHMREMRGALAGIRAGGGASASEPLPSFRVVG
jgi:hypothetical protein